MDELWEALTAAAVADNRLPTGVTVKAIMDGWTLEAGYPVLKVVDTNGLNVSISQTRFYLNPEAKPASDVLWTVPVNVAYPLSKTPGFDKTTASHWMVDKYLTVPVLEKPYIVNVKETGYYRVNYDAENWKALTTVLNDDHTKINELNRAQIIDDSQQLARAEQLDYDTALGLTEYLDKEADYIPWQSATRSFTYIDLMLNDASSSNEYSYLKKYIIAQMTPLYTKLGFEVGKDEAHITTLLRRSILAWFTKYEEKTATDKAIDLFSKWMTKTDPDTNNDINANLRDVVYGTGIKKGGEKEWNFLWERFLNATVDSERLKLIYALGASANEVCIKRYLTESLGENIRLQDVVYVYRAIGSSAPGRVFQFEWLKDNWDAIKAKFQSRFDGYMFNLVKLFFVTAYSSI
jgi:aminopeptidase N